MGNDVDTVMMVNNQKDPIIDYAAPEIYINSYIPRAPSTQTEENNNDDDKDETIEEKQEKVDAKLNSKSNYYVHNFAHKWLHGIDLRRIEVTNKLYGMNNKQSCRHRDLIEKAIERANGMKIHHSGIQMTLLNNDNYEFYLIFPNYASIISDVLINDDNIHRIKIKQSITSHYHSSRLKSMDTLECTPIYGYNYGYIKEANVHPVQGIDIKLECHGMYERMLFQNKAFKSKSALPMDILRIICDGYLFDIAHNDVARYEISEPSVDNKSKDSVQNYDWICHKLKNNNSKENIIFNTAINILGKYFTLETILTISCYDIIPGLYTACKHEKSASDDVIGKIF